MRLARLTKQTLTLYNFSIDFNVLLTIFVLKSYFVFSFDVRGRSFDKALQWSEPGAFGPRAHFATIARPASLTLSSVQLDDEGIYRCRVDFKNSPTRNFQIRLIVIGKF